MKKILVIEDEPNIRELVLYNLTQNSYEGIFAEDGETGLALARMEKPDLILLDIMLPEKNGYDICKELRAEGNKTPIIMLTAKNEEIDKVLGLEFGADDYISKPFGVRELMARIKAVLRRYESQNMTKADEKAKNKENRVLQIDDLTIDVERHEVSLGGKKVDLTLKEFDLLKTLAENRGIVMSRNQLLDKVWGFEYIGETRTVDVHVRYIRKKLGDEDNDGKYIQTVRGVGYKIP
ncbi:response regulator transcription factor [Anaerovorax odorimutans]|uniref:response regulator transcription factor n=1 Tax=Anaerovorax odorimutans TaxID=109327 RepID=UPI0003FF2559|nr:response regulator transcription factor [Anaerovorax odorimutans]